MPGFVPLFTQWIWCSYLKSRGNGRMRYSIALSPIYFKSLSLQKIFLLHDDPDYNVYNQLEAKTPFYFLVPWLDPTNDIDIPNPLDLEVYWYVDPQLPHFSLNPKTIIGSAVEGCCWPSSHCSRTQVGHLSKTPRITQCRGTLWFA